MLALDKELLAEVADLHEIPQGAMNIRKNGQLLTRNTTANIDIVTKKDKPGIDIIIKEGTKNESVHIPVLLTETGMQDLVYNDFYIGDNAEVLIVAGCGIHNGGDGESRHDGIHTFHIGKNAKVRYVEKHYGQGDGKGQRIFNPETIIEMADGSYAEMEMVQIKGINSTLRITKGTVGAGARLILEERLLTHGEQYAETRMDVEVVGEDGSVQVISRTVAQDRSRQVFYPRVIGKNKCRAHLQCDSIIMDNAQVRSIPEIDAQHPDAQLIHEAAIGKIAGEQIIKLMTLGLTEEEAEATILQGFLK